MLKPITACLITAAAFALPFSASAHDRGDRHGGGYHHDNGWHGRPAPVRYFAPRPYYPRYYYQTAYYQPYYYAPAPVFVQQPGFTLYIR